MIILKEVAFQLSQLSCVIKRKRCLEKKNSGHLTIESAENKKSRVLSEQSSAIYVDQGLPRLPSAKNEDASQQIPEASQGATSQEQGAKQNEEADSQLTQEDKNMFDELFSDIQSADGGKEKPKKKGRPAGSKNKNTEKNLKTY